MLVSRLVSRQVSRQGKRLTEQRFVSTCVAVLILFPLIAHALTVKIIYPKPGQIVTAIDSTFILGNISDELLTEFIDFVVTVNGYPAQLHRGGGFIAFLPVIPGEFTFNVLAQEGGASKPNPTVFPEIIAAADVTVLIPEPLRSLPDDSLQIISGYGDPSGDLVLAGGDRLRIMFRGTPGLTAWFTIPDVVDSVPMSETAPRARPYWGESVFGAGNVPESVMVQGIYSGFYDIPEQVNAKEIRPVYYLATPDKGLVITKLLNVADSTTAARLWSYLWMDSVTSLEAAYAVSLNPPEFPFTVRFTDSMQTIRHAPRKGYFSIFQPSGVEALVVGAEDSWYRVQLSATQFAWINTASVERLSRGLLPPSTELVVVRTTSFDDSVVVEFPLSGRHSFRIIEDDARTLRIQLFGVTSNTDWIRYDFSDPLIELASWFQPEPGLYEFKLRLSRDIWGYEGDYVGNTFQLRIMRPPTKIRSLKGKRIVIDAGHSADPGAIGPTGYTEAEANLEIALTLAKQLRRKGASVTLTRSDSSHLPLAERAAIARAGSAHLFISIHNNALPDGVNPFANSGVSTFYYHPHSIRLARAIQQQMIKATGLPDYGLYHANLAVNRPTQYPAVLVECAFMILPEQEAMLKTDRYRKKVSQAILRGIEDFLNEYERNNRQ